MKVQLSMKTPCSKGSRASRAWAVLFGACLGGCALSSKGEALTPRYFSPALLDVSSTGAAAESSPTPAAPTAPELRIGRIEPAAHLQERIAYRLGPSELAYYDDRRWTEPPEQFVRRALESELFERRAFRRVVAGVAPTLDVEVLSFEELRQGAPRARLALLVTLRDERHALLERTVVVEAPLAEGDGGPALAAAMAINLGKATEQIAEQVKAELEKAGERAVAAHEPRAGSNGNASEGNTPRD
jgi:cholesterol transport system auxiliary component